MIIAIPIIIFLYLIIVGIIFYRIVEDSSVLWPDWKFHALAALAALLWPVFVPAFVLAEELGL